jgi:hypothetical protein
LGGLAAGDGGRLGGLLLLLHHAGHQRLTLVHILAQRKHILLDTLVA